MGTITLTAADALEAVTATSETKPSFLGRIAAAMMASRQRRADIELRRYLALRNEPRERLDYALLPFAGE